jgi:hypothetical protein
MYSPFVNCLSNILLQERQRPHRAYGTLLDHVPSALKLDKNNVLESFNVCTERAASKIQAAWRQAWENPQYCICRARLQKEFESLSSQ